MNQAKGSDRKDQLQEKVLLKLKATEIESH